MRSPSQDKKKKKKSQPSCMWRPGSSSVAYLVSHHRRLGYGERRCRFDTRHQSTKWNEAAPGRERSTCVFRMNLVQVSTQYESNLYDLPSSQYGSYLHGSPSSRYGSNLYCLPFIPTSGYDGMRGPSVGRAHFRSLRAGSCGN